MCMYVGGCLCVSLCRCVYVCVWVCIQMIIRAFIRDEQVLPSLFPSFVLRTNLRKQNRRRVETQTNEAMFQCHVKHMCILSLKYRGSR